MSFSTFITTSVSALPTNTNWFSSLANSSKVESAQTIMSDPKDGRMKEMLSMLNSIGSLYSVPYLLFQKGYNYSEIAGQLKIPVGTVKSRVFTARVKMKHMIAKRKAA